ncbi:MAG: hypothetical protein R3362_05765 [Rhodothermales bacterium]|nr:hypothetical protein [Rhodothermales bacterium]
MPLRFCSLLLLLLVLASPARAQEAGRLVYVPFNVSVWRGISIGDAVVGGDTTARVVHYVSLNLPAGRAARLEGLAVGVFSTVYTESAVGGQVAGLANVSGGDAVGYQVAGLANVAGERLRGVQLAGLANVSGEDAGFLQVAGLANVAGESMAGIQAAGLANVVGGGIIGAQVAGLAGVVGEDVRGVQAAGFAVVAGERVEGVQAAGFASVAGDDVRGLQLAGLANVTGGVLRGVQVAPFNVAAESEGLQVGLANVAGEQRGVPVGLYSYAPGTPVRLDLYADETGALNVGVRSGSRTVSNFVGVGARPFADAAYRWGVFAGLGVERPLSARAVWGVDALVHALFEDDLGGPSGTLFRLRAHAARALDRNLALFGGPSLSLLLTDERDGLAPFTITESGGDPSARVWAGAVAGLRVRLR